MQRFANQTILVSGAASGIGAATAIRLHSEGATVVALDLDTHRTDAALADLPDQDRIRTIAVDVTDRRAVASCVAAAAESGIIHGLVNSAGIRGVGNILDVTPAELDQVLSVNLAGTVYLCQAFARAAASQPGPQRAIVNVTSAAGIRAVPNRLTYVASKFAAVGATQTMALELAHLRIRVNTVAPGMVRTPMTASMFEDPENVVRIRAAHPIGREAEPSEIGAAVAFLLSSDASYVTGAVLPVDGGNTAGIPSFGGRSTA